MGSGSRFGGDVRRAAAAIGSQRDSQNAFRYHREALSGRVQTVHEELNILDKIRECRDTNEHPETTPIVIGMDVTESRGDDTKRIYEQLPSMLGSILVSGIVPDPEIMSAAIGDANSDKAPIQVSQFESDERIDAQLEKIWMEKGGGGTGQESYELLAYYLAKKTELDCLKRGKKGYFFITGDESPYPEVSAAFIRSYIGGRLRKGVPTDLIFAELQQKYHVFFIFPRTTMQERIASIDREMQQRLDEAGGEYKNCHIRVTLIWNDFNDLDLHCRTPSGEHIWYSDKQAGCGGYLDVDRNAGGRETRKPVENIRWKIGKSRPASGKYEFWVNNFAYHENVRGEIPYKAELEVNGKIQTVEGVMPKNSATRNEPLFTVTFDPDAATAPAVDDHKAYTDKTILANWERLIPAEQILRVQDPKNSVEVMLGALALTEGKFDLSQFEADMKTRRVAKNRRDDVLQALGSYAEHGVFTQVEEAIFE